MNRRKLTLAVLTVIFIIVQGFQLDEFEEEPFLEVSDTYLKEEKLTPWFGKEHLSLNSKATLVKEAKTMLWGESDRIIVMLEVAHQ
jgi:hypothetical protein